MISDVYIPVLKDTKDPHYRYKMPKLTTKIEGSGNGIKTVLTNMSAVAKALGRPPSYPTKYFGCELGAQVTTANEFIVNGSHDPEKLLGLLYGFIRKFVLCINCNNPETLLTVNKDTIRQKCIVCGCDTTIDKAIHRLTSFIINHPPDGSNPKVRKSDKKSKKAEKAAEKKGTSPSSNSASASGGNRDGEFGQLDGDDDDFDDEEFTASAYTERIRELCDGFNSDMILSDKKETADIFYNLVKNKKEAGTLGDATVQRELVKEAERLNIKDKAVLVLSELLFTENILEEIKQYRQLLLRFCYENKKAQKYLLGAYEKLVGEVFYDKLFNSSLVILKQFYEQDVLEEESILDWSTKESKKYVSKEMSKKIHEKVFAFVKWLREAEEESEEDEDEESEEEEEEENDGEEGSESSEEPEPAKKPDQQTKSATKTSSTAAATQSKAVQKSAVVDNDDDDDDMFEFSHRVSGIQVKTVSAQAAAPAPGPINATTVPVNEPDDDLDIDDI